jgi:hypothetical protein
MEAHKLEHAAEVNDWSVVHYYSGTTNLHDQTGTSTKEKGFSKQASMHKCGINAGGAAHLSTRNQHRTSLPSHSPFQCPFLSPFVALASLQLDSLWFLVAKDK